MLYDKQTKKAPVQAEGAVLYCKMLFCYDIIKMTARKGGDSVLSASAGGHAFLRQASGGRKSLLFVPPFANAEGGMTIMVLNDVLQLFVIVGGTVGITFQIAWAIFKEIHNNKK